MGGVDGDRFKMIRRNSLRNEVDGSFDELEEFEDRNETTVNGEPVVPHTWYVRESVVSECLRLVFVFYQDFSRSGSRN